MKVSCTLCRGIKHLCGLSYCPVLVRARLSIKISKVHNSDSLYGSTPPAIFIPCRTMLTPHLLTPPELGDTSIYDTYELWLSKDLTEIVTLRCSLIGSYSVINNYDFLSKLQEIALSRKPVDVEVKFKKKPHFEIVLSEYLPPRGPSIPLRKLVITSNVSIEKCVYKVCSDELKANEAVIELYLNKVPISRIERIFSSGVLGARRNRKIVPTRWSITAVDSIISNYLISKIKKYPLINDYLIFHREYANNLFIIILIPQVWSYEWVEVSFPGSVWNLYGINVDIASDYEDYRGRISYASTGGCYYAARLAVTEYLSKINRQASVLVWREIYRGFNLPIGVWFVRENVRRTFDTRPEKFNSIVEVLNYIQKISKINIQTWIKHSVILRKILYQECLTRYLHYGKV